MIISKKKYEKKDSPAYVMQNTILNIYMIICTYIKKYALYIAYFFGIKM